MVYRSVQENDPSAQRSCDVTKPDALWSQARLSSLLKYKHDVYFLNDDLHESKRRIKRDVLLCIL